MAEERSFEDVWADVTPVPQEDGPNPVVKINYSAEFTKLMDIFRAVVLLGEYSERALDLTEELLEQNAANYSVWQYRRQCLQTLCSDLTEELEYMDGFSLGNPKNYQIWHHRRCVVALLRDGRGELAFTRAVFEVDAKNYHAWAHRQWALRTFGLWKGELRFVEQCLEEDVRNNSAWNQRWFCVHSGPEGPCVSEAVVQREVDFALDSIARAAQNESAWNYLRGLLREHARCRPCQPQPQYPSLSSQPPEPPHEQGQGAASSSGSGGSGGSGGGGGAGPGVYPHLHEAVRLRVLGVVQASASNALAMGLLADLYEEAADRETLRAGAGVAAGAGAGADAGVGTGTEAHLRSALQLCTSLVVADCIRAKSWTRRVLVLRQRLATLSPLPPVPSS